MVAMISSFYNTYIVLLAVGLTAGICLLLTLFAVQTKWDFTGCGMFLCVATLVVFLFGLAAMIVSLFTHIPILQLVYAGLIALLFSMVSGRVSVFPSGPDTRAGYGVFVSSRHTEHCPAK